MRILNRRKSSGFVKYPKDFEKRIIDGTARFRTKCDMLVGPCACGGVHQEHDDWVNRILADNNSAIEQLTLAPEENGTVLIPRYWIKPRGYECCNVLSGQCDCGRIHAANERWVLTMLRQHESKIVGCPEIEQTPVEDNCSRDEIRGCPCEVCQRQNGHGLNRSQI